MEKIERKSLGDYSSSPIYIKNAEEYLRIESDWQTWGKAWEGGTHKWKWKPLGININEINKLLLPLIIEIFGDQCAFCNNRPIYNNPSANYYTLEHFKPKKRNRTPNYSQHAYQWENLFPCCQKCNGYKDDQFDPQLLRPDDVSYDFDVHFEVDGKGNLVPKTKSAEVTIAIYKLNRTSLTKDRRNKVEEIETIFKAMGYYPNNLLSKKPYHFFLIRVLKSLKASSSLSGLGDIISKLEEN